MDYHLHRHGENVGIFSLEELRRRRTEGELSGEELVWREGMANWASLDSVLQSGNPTPATPPPPIPAAALKTKSNRVLLWGLLITALLVVAGITIIGPTVVKFTQGFRRSVRAVRQISAGAGIDLAAKKIAVSTNSLTEEIVRQRSREFRLRQYVEAYRKGGAHTASWDQDASQLMDAWIAVHHGGSTNLPSPQALADKLAALPDCDDPLILTAAAANTIERHEKIRRLERALAGFDQSRYRAYPKMYATVVLATDLGSQSTRIHSLDERAVKYFRRGFADGSFQPGDEEELAEILVNGWAQNFFKRNDRAVCLAVKQASGYPWLTLVLQGESEVSEAWRARGSGNANTVTAEGWKGFADHLASGRAALTAAWKLQPGRPLAPTRMIAVAMGDNEAQEMRTWFDRALEAQVDYPSAWSSMRWGLRPRWLGSHQAMLALGIQAVETKRFDTDVPRKFFDFISDVESELGQQPGEHIYGRADLWPHLKEMYEGYLAEPSQAQWRDAWRSTYATVAYLAGENELARKQLEALNWKPMRERLTGWGTDLSLMPLKVAALTGKSASEVSRAESSYEQLDLATPQKIYSELSLALEADDQTREFSRCRLATLKQESQLAKGEWIDFLPMAEKDPNWEFLTTKVRHLPDGAFEVESGPKGHLLYCRTRVGTEFEVTGSFELVRSSTRDFQAGLVMGLPDSQSSEWYAFRMKRNLVEGERASFSRGWTTQQISRKTELNTDRNTFRFCLRDGKADAWVNGVQVLQQAAPTRQLRLYSDCLLGLGAYNDTNETVIRYRNLKVRRLRPGQ